MLLTLPCLVVHAKQKPFNAGSDKIVVVGAGVNGLGVVISLLEKGIQGSQITVIEQGPAAGAPSGRPRRDARLGARPGGGAQERLRVGQVRRVRTER